MIKKYFLIAISFLFIVLLSIWQISGISSNSGWFSKINLILIVLSFILMFWDSKKAWWWALGFGLVFSFLSFVPFGAHLLTYLIIVLVGDKLLKKVFTNRSLYSFIALISFMVIGYNLLFYFLISLENIFILAQGVFIFKPLFWYSVFQELVLSIILASLLFYIFSSHSRRKVSFLSQK